MMSDKEIIAMIVEAMKHLAYLDKDMSATVFVRRSTGERVGDLLTIEELDKLVVEGDVQQMDCKKWHQIEASKLINKIQKKLEED